MKIKNFHILPEQTIDIEDKPNPASEFLGEYHQALGNGTVEYLGIRADFAGLNKATLGLDGLIVLGGIAGVAKLA